MYPKYKKLLQANKFFRAFDFFVRFFMLIIIRIIDIFHAKQKTDQVESYVFILHGGFGDLVLLRDIINTLSKNKKIIILLDKKLTHFEFIFTAKEIFYYDKSSIFLSLNNIKDKINFSHSVLIQTSPIFEIHFIKYYLGIRSSIGLKYSFNLIKDDKNKNFYKHNMLNKYETYRNIFHMVSNKKIAQYKRKNETGYYVISPTKNMMWSNVKIPSFLFAQLINEIIDNSGNKILIFGSKEDNKFNDEIINLVRDKSRIKNLTGQISLKEAVEIISESSLFIGNDNGMAHMASNLGVNTYVIFTFSDPKVYLWKRSNYKFYFNNDYKCMPCISLPKIPVDNYPVICNYHYRCLNTINVPKIISELKAAQWIGS